MSFIRWYSNLVLKCWIVESSNHLKVLTEFGYGVDCVEAFVSNLCRMNVVPEIDIVEVSTALVKWLEDFLRSLDWSYFFISLFMLTCFLLHQNTASYESIILFKWDTSIMDLSISYVCIKQFMLVEKWNDLQSPSYKPYTSTYHHVVLVPTLLHLDEA